MILCIDLGWKFVSTIWILIWIFFSSYTLAPLTWNLRSTLESKQWDKEKELVTRNWNTKIINMHKSKYKFVKKRNKCHLTIKSIITKNTISGKKKVETIKESTKRETNWRERERVFTFFVKFIAKLIYYIWVIL